MAKPATIEGIDADSPLEDAAKKTLTVRLGELRQYEERLTTDAEPDDVHDMRVASRRMRAALQLFDRKKQLAAGHKAVKRLGDALGGLRELQVQLDWLDKAARAGREADHSGTVVLKQSREKKLPWRIEAVHEAVAAWRDEADGVAQAIDALTQHGRLGGRCLRERLDEQLKAVRKLAKKAHASPDAATAHRLRIAVKKLRYVAELAEPAFPEPLAALLDKLSALQETLGNLHDSDVHLPLVEKFLVRADGVAQPGALALLRSEMARREQLAAQLGEALGQLQESRVLEELRDQVC
jgi:CHAD domain-containing protein